MRLPNMARRALPHLMRDRQHDQLAVVAQADLTGPLPHDLLSTILAASQVAMDENLADYAALLPLDEDAGYFGRWPGEHYRFLHGLTRVLDPDLTVEVGTYRGASALAMSDYSKRLVTFDVVPLDGMPGAIPGLLELRPNVEQMIGDLSNPEFFAANSELLRRADLVFVDGPKDGVFEPTVVPRIIETLRPGAFLVLDDVRFRSMQALWTRIDVPRIDVGCLGHSSGTGVCLIPSN